MSHCLILLLLVGSLISDLRGLTSEGSAGLLVTQSPHELTVKEGDGVQIQCCWNGNFTRGLVNWLDQRNETLASNNKTQFQITFFNSLQCQGQYQDSVSCNCSNLTLSYATVHHSGFYTCKVSIETPVLQQYFGNGTKITVATSTFDDDTSKETVTTVDSGYNELVPEEDEYAPRLDYNILNWCHSPSLDNGDVTCFSPRGGNYRSTLGTRCQMTCDRGYRLLGRASVRCMPSRRWSGTAHCRQVRCRVLPLIFHGSYTCSKGFGVDSRCDFTCRPGYRLEGEHSRTCLEGGFWSGSEPICSDHEPPKIRCPLSRVKVAEPGKMTARVSWDPPVATDTADKALDVILIGQGPDTSFNEGPTIVRYKVYDQARNRAACKFIVRVEVRRCPVLKPPVHGSLTCSSDGNNYGAECEYHCDGGYERSETSSRVCQLDHSWAGEPAECIPMKFNTDLKSASALLDQFYGKRRLLILSAPSADDQDYKLQNLMIQKVSCGLDLRHVTVVELLGSRPNEKGSIDGRELDAEVIHGLRQALRISRSYFNMVLLDKQGADRERFITTITADELFSHIEDFLLEEEERDRLQLYSSLCD